MGVQINQQYSVASLMRQGGCQIYSESSFSDAAFEIDKADDFGRHENNAL